jgi:spermidine synthase
MRFFELSPTVIEFARRHFSYLEDSAGVTDVVAGDGRLSLERELADPLSRGRYDIFVVDAFSGDSIPVHLLTRESIALYDQALAPGGVMAFHISNRHVDLAPVILALGEEIGWHTSEVRQAAEPSASVRESRWLLATRVPGFTRDMANVTSGSTSVRVAWTDAFSPLLPVVRWQ